MAEHTPGPWSVEIEDHKAPDDWYAAAIGVGSPGSGNYRTLARLPQADHGWDRAVRERGEADAHLIAAAPEMLAALSGLAAFIDANEMFFNAPVKVDELERLMDAGRAAIANAEGRTDGR